MVVDRFVDRAELVLHAQPRERLVPVSLLDVGVDRNRRVGGRERLHVDHRGVVDDLVQKLGERYRAGRPIGADHGRNLLLVAAGLVARRFLLQIDHRTAQRYEWQTPPPSCAVVASVQKVIMALFDVNVQHIGFAASVQSAAT